MPSVLSKLPVMMSDEDIIDPRYENTILYFLAHKDDVETKHNIYIGHTINKSSRICRHRINATDPKEKEYKCIFCNSDKPTNESFDDHKTFNFFSCQFFT